MSPHLRDHIKNILTEFLLKQTKVTTELLLPLLISQMAVIKRVCIQTKKPPQTKPI